MWDNGEKCTKTKKPKVILLLEYQYITNFRLRIREFLWKVMEKERANK